MSEKSETCWLLHLWAKWGPETAAAHAYQHRTCKRCGQRQYCTVNLGRS